MNIRKVAVLILGICIICMSGCGKQKTEEEKISLSVWTCQEDLQVVREMAEQFEQEYDDTVDLEVTVQLQNVVGIKDMVIGKLSSAADVYNFPDDQFHDLYDNHALEPVCVDKEKIVEGCGGKESGIVKKVLKEDELYAYPCTNSNGYFMYYNSKYFTKDDVKDLDTMLSIAKENGKYVVMDWTGGWYTYSFFRAAGMDVCLSEDRSHNVCDFNSTTNEITGRDVAEAMLKIASNKGFENMTNESALEAMKSGDVIACVSGTWNTKNYENIWGKDCAACKLPEYTVKGKKLQMCSVAGYKYIGVNPESKHIEWAHKLAAYLTNYDNQILRYQRVGECPAYIEAAESEVVQKSKAVSALHQQSEYAVSLEVGDNYWEPMSMFGIYMAAKNPDYKNLQKLLDYIVEEIEK